MFSKSQKSQKSSKGGVPSIISADLALTGDIVTDGEVHVDGRVEGDVTCNDLGIGETGSVIGEIVADTLRVFGEVRGRIRAVSVSLAATARVTGDILHRELAIEAGAKVDGLCRNMENPKDAPVARLAAPRIGEPAANAPAGILPPGQATPKRDEKIQA